MYVYGGNIYVNAEADGLDANGNINIYGGNLEVWGASRNADGDFVDLDGTMTISGGTFFGGGNAGMIDPSRWTNSQQAIYGRNQISANNVVYIVSGSTTITSYTSPKNIAYLYYTSPSATSSYQFSTTAPSNSGSTTDSTNNANDSTDNADDENTDVNTNSNTDANTEDTDDSIEILPVDGHWYLKINLLYLILTILAL